MPAGLSPQTPSKVPDLRIKQGSSWPSSALLWGGHLGSGATVTPRWTRHSDSPGPPPRSPASSPGRRGSREPGRLRWGSQPGCPGVEVRELMASKVSSSESLTAGAGQSQEPSQGPLQGLPWTCLFPPPTTYMHTPSVHTHRPGPPVHTHTVRHLPLPRIRHTHRNATGTCVRARAQGYPIGTHTHTYTHSQTYQHRKLQP